MLLAEYPQQLPHHGHGRAPGGPNQVVMEPKRARFLSVNDTAHLSEIS